MRVVAVMLAALAFGSTLAGAATPTRLASGLRGVVMQGPVRPVCDDTQPCDEPAPGVVLRFKRAGRLVARVTTGREGRYRVLLRPGRYVVTTPDPGPGAGLTPRFVQVPRGRVARVNFHLDTGIQ